VTRNSRGELFVRSYATPAGPDPSEPAPIRVEALDLEASLPEFAADARYRTAWVVAHRAGVPRAIVEVDLTEPKDGLEQLHTLAAQRPAEASTREIPDEALPSISVVVPSIIARVAELDRCLAGLLALDYPRFEVILVDNRRELPADDPLPRLIADRPRVRSVRAARPGVSAARNVGVEAATGEVVVFTDDDVQVEGNWLRAIGRRFVMQPELDAVTGLILPAELESPAQIYFERYYGGFSGERTFAPLTLHAGRGALGRARVMVADAEGHLLRRIPTYGVGAYGAGANMAFRRETLRRLGGFDEALGTGTPARGGEDLATLIDVLWSGGAVGYEPGAVVYHKHRDDYPALLHQLHGNGIGFSAMLASLISRDPRHLLGLAVQLPPAAQRLLTESVARLRGRKVSRTAAPVSLDTLYPPELAKQELRGRIQGIGAYLRSRRQDRAAATR
jgi:GT2 family glycosyltransferase